MAREGVFLRGGWDPNAHYEGGDKYPLQTMNEALLFCQDHRRIELYLFYEYLGIGKILGNWAQIPLYHVQGHWKSNPKSSVPHFTLSETLLWWQDPLLVELYLLHSFWGIGAIQGNLAQIPQTICKVTGKVAQSLQLHLSHEVRSYSSVKALWK